MPSSKKQSKTVAPYGFWESPISTDLLLQKATALSEVFVPANSESGTDVAWVELRMSESGRYALMHSSSLSSEDATEISAGKYSARSGVHEYGGGAAASLADGSFLFSDYNPKSFDVLRAKQGEEPHVVTPENPAIRYADFGPHPTDSELCLAVQEDHAHDTPATVVNSIVLLDLTSKPAKVHTLLQGKKADEETEAEGPQKRDFYTFPRFSPNGKYVCWVSWNHPSMPWWDTQLWVAKLDRSDPTAPKLVSPTQIKVPSADAGKQQVLQSPVWAIPANPADDAAKLFFACDATGFLNLYHTTISSTSSASVELTPPELILPEPVRHDFCGPAWTCNNSDYVALSPDLLVVSYSEGAKESLGLINLRRPRLIPLKTPFVTVAQLRRLNSTSFVLLATRPDEPNSLIRIDLRGLAASGYTVGESNVTVIKRSSTLIADGVIDKGYLSQAREIDFPTTLPSGEKAVAHAIVFEPQNKDFVGPKGVAPPCVFNIHGGPSASAGMGFNLQTAFWTSRGFMVCLVNYGGSTGYGREYLERLTGQWGVTDVIDCVAAAKYLGSKASLDPRPFGQLTQAEQDKVRQQIDAESSSSDSVVIEDIPGGGAKVTVYNTAPSFSWVDVALAAASLGAAVWGVRFAGTVMTRYAHCIPALVRPTTALAQRAVQVGIAALAVLPYVAGKVGRVLSESVAILPGVGVQLCTKRGLSLSPQRAVAVRSSTKIVPADRVVDVVVAEAYRMWSVVDYVGLVSSQGKGAKIERLFPNLLPRLSSVQRIYRALAPLLPTNTTKSSSPSRTTGRRSMADPSAMLISGGSAGGYTVLAALCFHPTIFAGGVSKYGISSLQLLAEESHKFESRYPFQLIGGTPQSHPGLYHDRSPLYAATNITAPVLLLQGSEDKVVPQSQADEFVKQLKKAGGKEGKDWKYVVYEGEGHGFRKSENIKDSLQQELAWWREKCLQR